MTAEGKMMKCMIQTYLLVVGLFMVVVGACLTSSSSTTRTSISTTQQLKEWNLIDGNKTSPLLRLQRIIDTENQTISITLIYEGHAWLSFGFSRDGEMVGSTVVIGFPDLPLQDGRNPGRYYLDAKPPSLLSYEEDEKEDDESTVSTTTSVPTVVRTTEPTAMPTVRPTWEADWPRQLRHPDDDDDEDKMGSNPRSLQQQRMLEIEDMSMWQNQTHTLLQFTQPISLLIRSNASTTDTTNTSSSSSFTSIHPNDLNTLIYAVGSSNSFGYHAIRGSVPMVFVEKDDECPYDGTAAFTLDASYSSSTSSYSSAVRRETNTFVSCILVLFLSCVYGQCLG
jgi:hypothetical protein